MDKNKKGKGKKDNKHNYGEIARICKLRRATTSPPIEKVLKPKTIRSEDEKRVTEKFKNFVKSKGYRGYKSKEEYLAASPESKRRREIIFANPNKKAWGAEAKRVQDDINREYRSSLTKQLCDIKSYGKYNDQVDPCMKEKWGDYEKEYYNAFNNLWNKRMLYRGQINILTKPPAKEDKYNHLTNGTHYKEENQQGKPSQDRLLKIVKDIKKERYRATQDIMNQHQLVEQEENLDFLEDLLNSHQIDVDNDDDVDTPQYEEGLVSIGRVRSLATNEGLQDAIQILSNLYATEADFSTEHLTKLNVIRFTTSIAIATSEARRYNDKIQKDKRKKKYSLKDLEKLNRVSEALPSYATTYVRELLIPSNPKRKGLSVRQGVLKVCDKLQKALNQPKNKTTISLEMIFFHYGLIFAALFAKYNRKVKNG